MKHELLCPRRETLEPEPLGGFFTYPRKPLGIVELPLFLVSRQFVWGTSFCIYKIDFYTNGCCLWNQDSTSTLAWKMLTWKTEMKLESLWMETWEGFKGVIVPRNHMQLASMALPGQATSIWCLRRWRAVIDWDICWSSHTIFAFFCCTNSSKHRGKSMPPALRVEGCEFPSLQQQTPHTNLLWVVRFSLVL